LSAQMALAAALTSAKKTDEIEPVAKTIDKLAAQIIEANKEPEAKRNVTQQVAAHLLASPSDAVADVGLSYARKAVKMLEEDTPTAQKAAAYKLLAGALASRGKKDEADKLAGTIDKMEAQLDAEYLKTSIPFEPVKFAGRKGKSQRVSLVELFTCTQ